MSNFLSKTPLPLYANVYAYNPKTNLYAFVRTLGQLLTRPVLKASINGGFQPITLELEKFPVQSLISQFTDAARLGGSAGAASALPGGSLMLGAPPSAAGSRSVTLPALANGQVARLYEQGGDGSCIYQGVIENLPDTYDQSALHHVDLSPMVVQMGTTNYTASWTNTDVAVIFQDIINRTPMLSWTAASAPATGIAVTFDFVNLTALQAVQQLMQMAGPTFYFFVDELGLAWMCNVDFTTVDLTLNQGSDFTARAFHSPITDLANYVMVTGGAITSDPQTISRTGIDVSLAAPFDIIVDNWNYPPEGVISNPLGSPYTGFVVTIDSEQLVVHQKGHQTLTVVARGYGGTVAATHANGATVSVTTVTGNTALTAVYDGTGSSPHPRRDFLPPPSFPNCNDLPTLQRVANTIGAWLNREIVKVELTLPAYGQKINLGVVGGTVGQYWEPDINPLLETQAGSGQPSKPLVVIDVEIDGGMQKLILSDLPFTSEDIQYMVETNATTALAATTAAVQSTNVPRVTGYGNLIMQSGTVVAANISNGTCTITLGSDPTQYANIPFLDSYYPTVGDAVSVIVAGADLLVIGRRAGSIAWITPTFQNGWRDYGSGNIPVGFRRVGNRVYMRGIITAGTMGAVVFALPPDCQPPFNMTFAATSNSAFGDIGIAAGNVYVNAGTNVWVSLDGITFDVLP